MKKVLSLVLALVMVLGSFSMVSAAPYSDVAGTTVESAVDRLSLLGILEGYPDGSFKPEGTITRAEFAAVAVRAKGLEAVAQASKGLPTGFKDVAATSWMSGYVGTAGKLGIVNGVGNGMFAPDAPVKYEEAVTMIVRALGYEAAAQAKGGYPYGYLIVANENGLLSAVKGTQGVPATRALVAQLTDNALEIPMMIQVGFGAQTKWVVSGTEETKKVFLLDDMGFDTYEGRVTSVNTKRNEITLDNEDADLKLKDLTVKVAKGFDFYEVEGLTIKAWYANGEVVLYTVTDEVKFDATKYDADDKEIILVTEDESYEVAKGAVLVLDGKKVDAKDFKADYAKVVLNEDNEIAWAEGFAIDGFIVVEEVKGTEVVSFNDDDLNLKGYTLVKEGKTIAIEDLEELDVVFYNDGEDFAVVYNNSKEGEIERVYTNEFKFDGKVYASTNALYLDEDVMGKLDADVLAGMMDEEEDVNVFFNFKGEVVLVVGARGVAKTSSFYGIVYNKTNFFTGRSGLMMSFDVRNEAGELVKYDLSQTFMSKAANYDGPSITWDLTSSTNLIDQVAKITVDEDGDVTKVVILDQKDLDKEFKTTATYARAGNVDYRLQSSTVVFYNSNKKAIKLGDVDKEFSKVTTPGKIVVDNGRVVVVVATSTNADSDSTKHTGLVTKVRRLSNDAYEFTIKVAGKTEVYVTESKTLNITESDYKDKIVTLEIGDKSGNVIGYSLATGDINDAIVESRNTTNNTIVTDKGTFELTSNAVIYNGKLAAINLRDIEVGNNITVYRDGNSNRFVNYVLVKAVGSVTSGTAGLVTYINEVDARFAIGSDVYRVNADTKLFNANEEIAAIGVNAILKTASNPIMGKKVTAIVVGSDGFVASFRLVGTADTLSEIKWNGTATSGVTTTETVTVPFSLNTVPTVTAKATDKYAKVEITQATKLVGTAAERTATIVVTPEDGSAAKTYTVEFSKAAASSVDTLSDIKVNGVSIAGFDPSTLTYTVTLTPGTTLTPVVTATATDSNASVLITPATDVTAGDNVANATTIKVTPEDNGTAKTYKVIFN